MEQKTIPFSEAMLLGLPEIRFSNSTWLTRREDGCMGCLVGAALYAVGHRNLPGSVNGEMAKFWPWMESFPVVFGCPWCEKSFDWRGYHETFNGYLRAADLATHLARHYKYDQVTAEQIAEVFRKLEPKEKEKTSEAENNDAIQRSTAVGVAGD